MDATTWDPEKIGIVSGVIVILILGAKEVWVWGHHYRRAVARADKLEELLFRTLGVAQRVVDKERHTQETS